MQITKWDEILNDAKHATCNRTEEERSYDSICSENEWMLRENLWTDKTKS